MRVHQFNKTEQYIICKNDIEESNKWHNFMLEIAEEIMTTDVITVSPNTEIVKAAKIMMEKRINGLPVVDSGKLVGILCQSDLIAQQKKFPIPSLFTFLDGYISLTSEKHLEKEVQKIAAATVDQAMTPHPVTVSPTTKRVCPRWRLTHRWAAECGFAA